MTSSRFRLSPKAEETLLDIYTYTRNTWSEAQAERYLSGFRKALDRLVTFPQSGTVTSPGSLVRRALYEKHTIFYRLTPDGIEIGRIYGPGQDFTRELAAYERDARRFAKRERAGSGRREEKED